MFEDVVEIITNDPNLILRLRKTDGEWDRLRVFSRRGVFVRHGDGDEWKFKEIGLTYDEIEQIAEVK